MSKDVKIDGQLNFLEMMGAYTDESGASISVSKPRTEIRGRKRNDGGISVKEGNPMEKEGEQLSFNLDILTIDGEAPSSTGNGIVVRELEKIEINDTKKKSETFTEVLEPVVEKKTEIVIESKNTTTEPLIESAEGKDIATEPLLEIADNEEAEIIEAEETSVEKAYESEPEPETKAPKKTKSRLKNKAGAGTVTLFDKCSNCWCSDCMHNSRNEGKPREMCGMMMACPACETCIEQGYAEICEIGSAKEGCKTRAIEEGLYAEEESI